MSHHWQLQPAAPKEFLKKFPEFSSLVLQLLYNRGIRTQEQVDEFFNPDYGEDLFCPFLLKDMDKAVGRVAQAVAKKERVAIFGDYDADGVTSSVILTKFLKNALGLSGQVYIPDRTNEGYGMNKTALDWLIEKKISLVITCDCGVSNKKEIDYGRAKGLDFIVLDHHHAHQKFSDEYIVVDPKREGDKYPFKELAGCGVVFKFVQAVFTKHENLVKKGVNSEAFIKWLLDLVALGTVADCVPLISENRTLVRYGLKILAKNQRLGLQRIMAKARLKPEQISAEDLGYMIAPRLNAAGRIDHANTAYKLLATNNKKEAEEIAESLEKLNYQRQKLCKQIIQEAEEKIAKSKNDKIIFALGENWSLGIVGLVAGKLCEEFSRPVFVLNKGKKEIAGSARSTEKFNVIEAIEKCGDLLLEFGGHKQAAGITLENKNFAKFAKKMRAMAKTQLRDEDLISTLKIDSETKLENLNWDLYDELEKFAPYGQGNHKPVFMTTGLKIMQISLVGGDKQHLKMMVADPENSAPKVFEAIGFNKAKNVFQKISMNGLVDLVYEINCNAWNGSKKLELRILDYKANK